MPDEFVVMRWNGAFDGAWSAEAEEKYRAGGFDGLSLVAGSGWSPDRLEFLVRLPGLRYLSVAGKVADDRAAFEIGSLEDLTLVTGCKKEIPKVVNPALRRLCLTNRRGVVVAERWPGLEYLRVGEWRSDRLDLVEGADRLIGLHLEGRRQSGSLVGVEGCRLVEELIITGYAVEGTSPLRSLERLRELRLLAMKPTPPHRNIDLADVRSSVLGRLWIGHAERVDSFDVLPQFTRLREARFIDCGVPDDTRGAVMASAQAKNVTIR